MNNIITLDQLVIELARRANLTTDEARTAIMELQQEIIDSLIGPSGIADVPHIGRFTVTDTHNGTIEFIADSQMAETINEPFAFFEPVQLYADGIDTADTTITEPTREPEPTTKAEESDNEVVEEITAEEPIVIEEPIIEAPAEVEPKAVEETQAAPIPVRYHYTVPLADEPINETTEVAATEQQPIVAEQSAETEPNEEQPTTPADYNQPHDNGEPAEQYDETPRNGMSPLIAYILGILTGMILMCVAVYFLYPPLNLSDDEEYVFDDNESTVDADTVPSLTDNANTVNDTPNETKAEPAVAATDAAPTTKPTAPAANSNSNQTDSKGVITDTVSSTNYLAIMARKYYGNTEFWVYIYKENEAILGHPDRVPAGTVVVIPPASKYGIDANDPESIRRAKKLNGPIYAPYRK